MPIDIENINTFEDLKSLSTKELRGLYRQALGYPPPRFTSRDFLAGNLAWAIQTAQIKRKPIEFLDQLINRSLPDGRDKATHLRPGTRLVREWHGRIYEVTVTEDGFLWEGRHYKTLTPISQEITGAAWSGPRFFGLKKRKS